MKLFSLCFFICLFILQVDYQRERRKKAPPVNFTQMVDSILEINFFALAQFNFYWKYFLLIPIAKRNVVFHSLQPSTLLILVEQILFYSSSSLLFFTQLLRMYAVVFIKISVLNLYLPFNSAIFCSLSLPHPPHCPTDWKIYWKNLFLSLLFLVWWKIIIHRGKKFFFYFILTKEGRKINCHAVMLAEAAKIHW